MSLRIKELVENGQLVFADGHRTNEKYYLENDPTLFLKHMERLRYDLEDVYCFSCGKYVDYTLKGHELVPSVSVCFNEKEVVLDIPVPSGELMFDDWFEGSTPLLEHLDKKTFDINCTQVQVERARDYAKEEVGHFFVGGSYPRVCEKDGVFYIGRGKNMMDEDDDGYEDVEVPIVEGGVILGSIETELRWTTLIDYAIYETMAVETFGEKKGIKKAQEAKKYADLVIHVEPGTYRITYYPDRDDDIELYAKIEKL